jgi:divalent metal cation (Fe/Co/Zn/Cd) transporter
LVLAVLAISLLLDSASLIVSLRESGPAIGRVGWWRAFRNSKNPPSFITLFTNSAALGGDVVAGAGMGLAITTGRSRWDAVASLIIGAFLAVSAALLARESKGLLIGERADPELGKAILAAARGIEGIGQANGIATVQLAPDQVVVNLSIEFDDALHTTQIEAAVVELERRLREAHPQITAVFVKPQAAEEVRRRLAQGGIGVTPDGE